jgi:hypothetical protein
LWRSVCPCWARSYFRCRPRLSHFSSSAINFECILPVKRKRYLNFSFLFIIEVRLCNKAFHSSNDGISESRKATYS